MNMFGTIAQIFKHGSLSRGARFLYRVVLKPRSSTEDDRRRELILNILLAGAMVLGCVATVIVFHEVRTQELYRGVPIVLPLGITVFYLFLYILSRRGYAKVASLVFVSTYLLVATYMVVTWGIDLPQALMVYALVIVMSGVLLSSNAMIAVTVLVGILIVVAQTLHGKEIIVPSTYWKENMLGIKDAIVIVVTLAVIALVSWLSNKEIDRSLVRARKSEHALREERDLLEARVDERTKELRRVQSEKAMHLYRFAEFGKMTAGLFHDLVNPLNAVSLNLEYLQDHATSDEEAQSLGTALKGLRRVQNLIQTSKNQVRTQDISITFNVTHEVAMALEVLNTQARRSSVSLEFIAHEDIPLRGNPIKLYRVLTSLVMNAIEAYDALEFEDEKRVIITLNKKENTMVLDVQDFGPGILDKYKEKIFDELFTTKDIRVGTGLGLSIARTIVEQEFGGTITMKSNGDQGTCFTVTIPLT